jgi:outer membrane protein OmpU
MNNLKKIGLTALAGSLVVTSAFAGELTTTGAASMGLSNITGTNDDGLGKNLSMGNQITFAGSGELDNGMTVSLSFTLDQADPAPSPFDGHSVSIGSDALGTLKLSGQGGSSAQGAMDTTAAGDIWNQTLGLTGGPTAAASGDNSLYYTLPNVLDGVAATVSLSPGGANVAGASTHTSYGLVYTGVEGLTLKFGQGDSGADGATIKSTTMFGSYAIGSFTVSVSNTDADKTGAANTELNSFQLAYTVSDNLSVTYGEETHDLTDNATDEEVTAIGVSYTTGGMTISANQYEAKGGANTAGALTDKWALSAAFAF